MNPNLRFMHDNASGHATGTTVEELRERGINPIFWSAYSPDLNPIETLWCIMKDYIQLHFGEKLSYDRLREACKEAWEAIGIETLRDQIASMPARCQACIDVNGLHTKF